MKDPESHPKFLAARRLFVMMILLLGMAMVPALRSASFDPMVVTLQPKISLGITPTWMAGTSNAPAIHPDSDFLDLPVPSLNSQEEIGCFALTVVFDDNGDGGPVVEWISKQGDHTLLSAGLGDNGVALGLNARTLLIPQAIALDGGAVRVSFASRFSRLISTSLRPARELGVAALGENFNAALIADSGHVLSEEEVSGSDIRPNTGDRTDGHVIHADLASLPVRLDFPGSEGVMEFVIPLAEKPVGSLIQAEVGGLDPESWIEVSVNGESRGTLAPVAFSLNDPSVVISADGHLRVAGWRGASVYIPARLWTTGDNSVVLTLHRSGTDAGTPVYLRKVSGDLLFPASTTLNNSISAANIPQNSQATNAPMGTLSNGSLYGNPSPNLFHAAAPTPIPATPSPTTQN